MTFHSKMSSSEECIYQSLSVNYPNCSIEYQSHTSLENYKIILINFSTRKTPLEEEQEGILINTLDNISLINTCTFGVPKDKNLSAQQACDFTVSASLVDLFFNIIMSFIPNLNSYLRSVLGMLENAAKSGNVTQISSTLLCLNHLCDMLKSLTSSILMEEQELCVFENFSIDVSSIEEINVDLQNIICDVEAFVRSIKESNVEDNAIIKIKKNIDELLSNYVEKINRPLNSFSKQYQEHFSLQHFSQFEQFYLSTKQMMNNLSGLIFIGLDISIFSDVNISYLNSLEQVSKIEVELINSLHTVMSFKNTTSLKLISSRLQFKEIFSLVNSLVNTFKSIITYSEYDYQIVTQRKIASLTDKLVNFENSFNDSFMNFTRKIQTSNKFLIGLPISMSQLVHKKTPFFDDLIQALYLFSNSLIINGYCYGSLNGLANLIQHYHEKLMNYYDEHIMDNNYQDLRISCLNKKNLLNIFNKKFITAMDNYKESPLNTSYQNNLELCIFDYFIESCAIEGGIKIFEFLNYFINLLNLIFRNNKVVTGECIITYKRFIQLISYSLINYISQFFSLLIQQIQMVDNDQGNKYTNLDFLNSKLYSYLKRIRHSILYTTNFQISSYVKTIINEIKNVVSNITFPVNLCTSMVRESHANFNQLVVSLSVLDNQDKFIWDYDGVYYNSLYYQVKESLKSFVDILTENNSSASLTATMLSRNICDFCLLTRLFENSPIRKLEIIEDNASLILDQCIAFEISGDFNIENIKKYKSEIEQTFNEIDDFIKNCSNSKIIDDIKINFDELYSRIENTLFLYNDEKPGQSDIGQSKIEKLQHLKLKKYYENYISGTSSEIPIKRRKNKKVHDERISISNVASEAEFSLSYNSDLISHETSKTFISPSQLSTSEEKSDLYEEVQELQSISDKYQDEKFENNEIPKVEVNNKQNIEIPNTKENQNNEIPKVEDSQKQNEEVQDKNTVLQKTEKNQNNEIPKVEESQKQNEEVQDKNTVLQKTEKNQNNEITVSKHKPLNNIPHNTNLKNIGSKQENIDTTLAPAPPLRMFRNIRRK